MAKTLVVKLAGTVNNDELPYFNAACFSMSTTGTVAQRCIKILPVTGNVKLLISGGNSAAHFTDSGGTQNLGKEITLTALTENSVYVSVHEAEINILNKTGVKSLVFAREDNITMDLIQLKNCFQLITLDCTKLPHLSGDIKYLAGCPDLRVAYFGLDTNVTGNISALSGLTSLSELHLFNTGVEGNLSSLAGLTNLSSLALQWTRVTGDTSSIAHLHPNNGGKLASFEYEGTSITGTWPPASA